MSSLGWRLGRLVVPDPRPAGARPRGCAVSLFNTADPAYFGAIKMQILAGRSFTDADRAGSRPVAVVNETLARSWWPKPQMALGHVLKNGGPYNTGPVYEIVGIVRDVSQMGLDKAPLPEAWFAFS